MKTKRFKGLSVCIMVVVMASLFSFSAFAATRNAYAALAGTKQSHESLSIYGRSPSARGITSYGQAHMDIRDGNTQVVYVKMVTEGKNYSVSSGNGLSRYTVRLRKVNPFNVTVEANATLTTSY